MNESFLQKAEEIFHQAAIKLSLEVVSIKNYNDPEMGKVLEVLLDHDYNITMEEIEAFTDMVNPLLDEIADDDKEGYILDIASGASEKKIPFEKLSSFVEQWLDVKLKESGEVKTLFLDEVKDDTAKFHCFIKGKRTKVLLNEQDVLSIKMGYKA